MPHTSLKSCCQKHVMRSLAGVSGACMCWMHHANTMRSSLARDCYSLCKRTDDGRGIVQRVVKVVDRLARLVSGVGRLRC